MKLGLSTATAALLLASSTDAFVTRTSGAKTHVTSALAALILPNVPPSIEHVNILAQTESSSSSQLNIHIRDWLQQRSLRLSLVEPAYAAETIVASPPTKQEIALLREAFAAFYGAERDPSKALELLSKAVDAWQLQPGDERAGLYRVRGDCFMALEQPNEAIGDYSTAIDLLKDPAVAAAADPVELPASLLGRARAIRSLGVKATKEQAMKGAADYKEALVRSSREEWDTQQELLEDGARTNPYATWEYGMALRLTGDFSQAQAVHTLAANYFDDIGDRARSVISRLDAGIDAAAGSSDAKSTTAAKTLLVEAIASTKTVEGRDIPLLQRVIAKEGEGRMALASLEWTSGEKQKAESQLELTCERLDQLEEDAIQRNKINQPPKRATNLRFNIDDVPGALDTSCSRLKNKEFLTDRLEWPAVLQDKLFKLKALS
jgi:tetratricopeptide (TPR) repeat protein